MQRAVGTVLVVVLVVLAGCSGVFGGDGGGESTPTVTPMTVPTDEPTPTPVPQLAPGITGQGIENATALVAAHSSFLQNRSFTKRSNSTGLGTNGSVLVHSTSTIHAGPVGEGIYAVTERNSSEGYSQYPETFAAHIAVWANDGRTLSNRTYANGTTRYDRSESGFQTRFGAAGAALRYRLESFDTTTTSVTERQRNGSTLYLVRGKTRTEQTFANGNTSLRMLVDSRGVIHSYRTVQQLPTNENLTRGVSTTRFSAIGVTGAPERPSWVDTALNRTTSIPSPTPSSANATASTATTTTGPTANRNATTVDTTTGSIGR